MRYLLSIGSNLGDRAANLDRAIEAIQALPHAWLEVSSFHESEPMYVADQPEFLNAAVAIESELSPAELLGELQRIEVEGGRTRGIRFGPRPIDIDIVAAEDLVVDTEVLQIPHQRMHERPFVLDPLLEVDPAWVHPTMGATVEELRARLNGAE